MISLYWVSVSGGFFQWKPMLTSAFQPRSRILTASWPRCSPTAFRGATSTVTASPGRIFADRITKNWCAGSKEGDVIYLKSIDRLGRNYNEVLIQWQLLTKTIGADIVVLDMALLDTREKKGI